MALTTRQLLELTSQHHPELGETQMILWFNQAMERFADDGAQTKTAHDTFSTVVDQQYYDLTDSLSGVLSSITRDDQLIHISQVRYGGENIGELINPEDVEGY
ncbi:MAG: hypothetical protein HN932_12925 [Candidatus Marinimicrobia bacterium]|jgi:hypothetical protein|nr:hypothetical protein [Candidatus Neomarinimicrobiota bacterium]MBT7339118.1 hypothetical protein [Candidatus Jacksonbacteria bacterium]